MKDKIKHDDADAFLELDNKWKGKIGIIQKIEQDDSYVKLESGEKFWINSNFCELISK